MVPSERAALLRRDHLQPVPSTSLLKTSLSVPTLTSAGRRGSAAGRCLQGGNRQLIMAGLKPQQQQRSLSKQPDVLFLGNSISRLHPPTHVCTHLFPFLMNLFHPAAGPDVGAEHLDPARKRNLPSTNTTTCESSNVPGRSASDQSLYRRRHGEDNGPAIGLEIS